MWSDHVADYEENNEKMVVDVGGVSFTTTKETLRKSPYFDRIIDTARDNYIFVDRDFTAFVYVLNYLRTDKCFVTSEDMLFLEFLKTEAAFYELHNMVKLLQDLPRRYTVHDLVYEMKNSSKAHTFNFRQTTRKQSDW